MKMDNETADCFVLILLSDQIHPVLLYATMTRCCFIRNLERRNGAPAPLLPGLTRVRENRAA